MLTFSHKEVKFFKIQLKGKRAFDLLLHLRTLVLVFAERQRTTINGRQRTANSQSKKEKPPK